MINRQVLVLLFVALAVLSLGVAPARQEPAPTPAPAPAATPALDLGSPIRRTRPGLVFVAAKVAAPAGAKVKVVWDVECAWDDDRADCEWEVRDGGMRLQVVIPDASGTVRIAASATVDGEPTPIAKTRIEMRYVPRGRLAAPAPPPAAVSKSPAPQIPTPAPVGRGKITDAWFVIDGSEAGDPNVNALVTSMGLKNRLRALGVRVHVIDKADAQAAELAQFTKDAGGAPAMVLITGSRQVRRAEKIPQTAEAIAKAVGG